MCFCFYKYQIQKLRLEHEDKLRQLQSQAVEDKSNLGYYKNAETDNLKEIEQLKSAKRRLEDDYFDLNDKLDQYIQSDSYKVSFKILINFSNSIKNYIKILKLYRLESLKNMTKSIHLIFIFI